MRHRVSYRPVAGTGMTMVDLGPSDTSPLVAEDTPAVDARQLPENATPRTRLGPISGGDHDHADDHGSLDPWPLAGYAVLLASYGGLVACLTVALRQRRDRINPLRFGELLLFGLATQHISRVIAKDSVTGVIRAPMVSFDAPAGDGEVNEQVEGEGLRHALGELVTCPFCLAQWIATVLVAGRSLAPTVTTGVVAVAVVARISDYLQLAYDWAKQAP